MDEKGKRNGRIDNQPVPQGEQRGSQESVNEERRKFLSKLAVGGAAFVAGFYIKPQVKTLLAPQVAHAQGSSFYDMVGVNCQPDVCVPVQLEQAGLCQPYICGPGDGICSPAYCGPHGF